MRVLSCGAGRQTLTLAMLSAEGALPKLDAAVFADTGWEPKAVYRQLDRLEREVLQPAGIPLYRVSKGNLRDDVLNPDKMRSIPAHTLGKPVEVRDPLAYKPCDCEWARLDATEVVDDEQETPPYPDCDKCSNKGLVVALWGPPYLKPTHGMQNRRCTQIYKLNKILQQTRLLLGAPVRDPKPCRYCSGAGERIAPWRAKRGEYVMGTCSVCEGEGVISEVGQPPKGVWAEQWIGFSADEVGRVSNSGDTRYSRSRYPLLELGMTVTQCLAYLKSRGWESVVKSACIGCPYHGNAAWRRMRDTDPESWRDAVEFDKQYRHGAGMQQERYLHISRLPLDQAPIDRIRPSEWLQPSLLDAVVELDLERLENGDPDGCSPWACRSGEAVS
jgi:hypothetical protein